MLRPAVCGLALMLGACQLPLFGGDPAAPVTPAATPQPAAPKPAPPAPKPVVVGGFAATGCEESQCKEAQAMAVQTIYRQDPQRGLVEAATVEQQVVAGMNYRFHITMTGAKNYSVTVYRDLQGNLSVTNFSKEVTAQ
ncbi:MAG TPA: hypothetical protein VG942_08735 [Hyphomonadaceae bacterium]|nr:hypothetical protein [Hyphomonadaceae bacterium]